MPDMLRVYLHGLPNSKSRTKVSTQCDVTGRSYDMPRVGTPCVTMLNGRDVRHYHRPVHAFLQGQTPHCLPARQSPIHPRGTTTPAMSRPSKGAEPSSSACKHSLADLPDNARRPPASTNS